MKLAESEFCALLSLCFLLSELHQVHLKLLGEARVEPCVQEGSPFALKGLVVRLAVFCLVHQRFAVCESAVVSREQLADRRHFRKIKEIRFLLEFRDDLVHETSLKGLFRSHHLVHQQDFGSHAGAKELRKVKCGCAFG